MICLQVTLISSPRPTGSAPCTDQLKNTWARLLAKPSTLVLSELQEDRRDMWDADRCRFHAIAQQWHAPDRSVLQLWAGSQAGGFELRETVITETRTSLGGPGRLHTTILPQQAFEPHLHRSEHAQQFCADA